MDGISLVSLPSDSSNLDRHWIGSFDNMGAETLRTPFLLAHKTVGALMCFKIWHVTIAEKGSITRADLPNTLPMSSIVRYDELKGEYSD